MRHLVLAGALCAALSSFAGTLALADVASFYGKESGTGTASGRPFNENAMTAAHRTLPFGTKLRVCYRGCVVVTVTDRGPFIKGRTLDLSKGAARAIGMLSIGVARVNVERL